MRIYFRRSGTISTNDLDVPLKLLKLGHEVMCCQHLCENRDEIVMTQNCKESIREADVIIFEVMQSNLELGYEIALALESLKPVIILIPKGLSHVSTAFKALDSDTLHKLQLIDYTKKTIATDLRIALDYAREDLNVRFNLIISSRLNHYLGLISNREGLSKSAFVRRLIRQNINEHEEFFSGGEKLGGR